MVQKNPFLPVSDYFINENDENRVFFSHNASFTTLKGSVGDQRPVGRDPKSFFRSFNLGRDPKFFKIATEIGRGLKNFWVAIEKDRDSNSRPDRPERKFKFKFY